MAKLVALLPGDGRWQVVEFYVDEYGANCFERRPISFWAHLQEEYDGEVIDSLRPMMPDSDDEGALTPFMYPHGPCRSYMLLAASTPDEELQHLADLRFAGRGTTPDTRSPA